MAVDRLVKKLLLIEDDVYAIERIKKICEKFDFLSVETVSDYKKAREKLELWKWDIVITDSFLYGITAIEVNHIARAKNKDVCVIVLSDLSTVDIAQKAVKEGAFDYVLKPQDIEKVESLIRLYAISKK